MTPNLHTQGAQHAGERGTCPADSQAGETVRADAARNHATLAPVLLDVPTAARFLSIGECSIREYAASGVLQPAVLPPLPGREGEAPRRPLKRLLFHIDDLREFAGRCRGRR
jgi:hypothetical protein